MIRISCVSFHVDLQYLTDGNKGAYVTANSEATEHGSTMPCTLRKEGLLCQSMGQPCTCVRYSTRKRKPLTALLECVTIYLRESERVVSCCVCVFIVIHSLLCKLLHMGKVFFYIICDVILQLCFNAVQSVPAAQDSAPLHCLHAGFQGPKKKKAKSWP